MGAKMIRILELRIGWWVVPPLIVTVLTALASASGEYKLVKFLPIAVSFPLVLMISIVWNLALPAQTYPWHGSYGEIIIAVMLIANWYLLGWSYHTVSSCICRCRKGFRTDASEH